MSFFSSKLNTDFFIRSIYPNICMLFPYNILFRKFINWERKGNFKYICITFICWFCFTLGFSWTVTITSLFSKVVLMYYVPLTDCPASAFMITPPSNMSCHIPEFCTGLQCCLAIPVLKRSFQFHVYIEACSYVLSIGIEKYYYNVSLLSYEWGKTNSFSLLGAMKIK